MLLNLESCSCSYALFVSAAKELWKVWFLVEHAELSAKPGCGPELHQCLLLEQLYARGYAFPRTLLMWVSCLYLRINIINDQCLDFVCRDCPQRFSPLSREMPINWISSPESQVHFQLLAGFMPVFTITTKDSLCNLFFNFAAFRWLLNFWNRMLFFHCLSIIHSGVKNDSVYDTEWYKEMEL